MNLISWKNWKESSPATRAKRDVALGLKPLAAMSSPFGHSSEPPAICDKVKDMIEDDGKKKKKKDKKDESKAKAIPNYSFDKFLNKAEKTRAEVDADKEQAEKEEAELDQKIKQKEMLDKKKKFEPIKKIEKKPDQKLDKEDGKEVESKEDDKTQKEWAVLCGDLV